jgi:hypothetical protein
MEMDWLGNLVFKDREIENERIELTDTCTFEVKQELKNYQSWARYAAAVSFPYSSLITRCARWKNRSSWVITTTPLPRAANSGRSLR